jgi:FAD-dependent oxidoreductase domain-containing protein 1
VARRDRYDVVIVGAGAFGLAAAYHLAREQPSVSILVLEARAGPGEGSMGASNSMVRDVFSSPDNQLLARSSIAFYRHLMDEVPQLRGPVPLLDLFGYLWLLPERELQDYHALVARSGGSLDACLVDRETIASLPGLDLTPARWFEGDGGGSPEPIAGGLFGRNCGALAPDLLARYYAEAAAALGVEFEFNACVRRLSFEGREEILLHEGSGRPLAFQEHIAGRLRIARVVLGDGRSIGADRVVVAGGAWSERILHPLGFATGCSPRPQGLFAVSGPAVDQLLAWRADLPALDAPGGGARLPFLILPSGATAKPLFTARRLWLGCVDTISQPIGTREDPGADGRLEFSMGRMVERGSYATDLLPAVSPYLPALATPEAHLENAWGGYYSFSPDGLPVLAEEPYGVLFVGGDSGSGIMKADALGRLVAARCAGHDRARLFTGETYRPDQLSLAHRDVTEERIIL